MMERVVPILVGNMPVKIRESRCMALCEYPVCCSLFCVSIFSGTIFHYHDI